MSDIDNEFETPDENAQEPGQLRQLLKQAHAQLKAVTKERDELNAFKASLSVKATWDELKVPDAIRKLYNGDTSTEAIKAWWEDSKGLFNIEQAAEQPAEQQLTPEQVEQQQQAQQFQDAQALGSNAIHSGFDAVKRAAENAAEAYRTGQMSRADFNAARKAHYEATGTRGY